MKMIPLLGLLLFIQYGFAQNTSSKADDISRISLNTYVPEKVGSTLRPETKKMLENKLSQIATRNGAGGFSANPRFIITANLITLTKDITPSAPPMTSLSLEATFYIADYQTKTKHATTSLTLKGVGQNETKAYIEALKQINPDNPLIRQFVDAGKTKIIEYYNTNCDFILKEAQALVGQNKFDEAIYKLTSVPDVCKECYEKSMDAVIPVYKKYIDRECIVNLSNARNAFNASPNFQGAESSRVFLARIDPEATCFAEAKIFSDSVRTKISKNEKRDWDFMMKRFDAEQDLSRQRIQSMKEVGISYGNNQPNQVIQRNASPSPGQRSEDWIF